MGYLRYWSSEAASFLAFLVATFGAIYALQRWRWEAVKWGLVIGVVFAAITAAALYAAEWGRTH